MFERVLNNTNFYFDEPYFPQLLTPPDWCKIPFPSLITPSSHSTTLQLSYRELRYLKKVLESYPFCQNSWKDTYGGGGGGGGEEGIDM